MPQAVIAPMEHRWGRRVPCRARVRLSVLGGIVGTGRLRDVSMSGAFLETALQLPLFTRVTLAVPREDPTAGREVDVIASVVRISNDGLGLEWCDTAAGSICAVLGCTTRCAAASAP